MLPAEFGYLNFESKLISLLQQVPLCDGFSFSVITPEPFPFIRGSLRHIELGRAADLGLPIYKLPPRKRGQGVRLG